MLLLFISFFLKNGTSNPGPIPLPLPDISVGSDGKASFGIEIDLPMVRRNGADAASGDKMTYDSENRLTKIEDDSGNLIANYFYDQGGQRSKKVLKDGSVVYEFGGIYEIAIPNGKPQQQTIYIRGLQGEIVAQMTDPAATLVTANDIRDNERYALSTVISNMRRRWSAKAEGWNIVRNLTQFLTVFSFNANSFKEYRPLTMGQFEVTGVNLTSSLKHFINRHVVLNSKLLFQDHSSLAYILGGNRLSDKTRITVLLLFLMMLFYLDYYMKSGHDFRFPKGDQDESIYKRF